MPALGSTFAAQYTTSISPNHALSSKLSSPVAATFSAADTPMRQHKKCSISVISTLLSYLTLSASYSLPNGAVHETVQDKHPPNLIASPSWLHRQSCRWLGVCGLSHFDRLDEIGPTSLSESSEKRHRHDQDSASFWISGSERPEDWSSAERLSREIPQYVYDHTPYVHLFSGEQFWPCDIAEHLVHTVPYLNYTQITKWKTDRTLDNLNDLNDYGQNTFLQSEDNVEERPEWLGGSANIPRAHERKAGDQKVPEADGNRMNMGQLAMEFGQKPIKQGVDLLRAAAQRREKSSPDQAQGGHSSAPAILIVVPKDNGIVDAFWFYFYSYNLGNQVLNVRFGNHVGDWEHSMVRFVNGTPQAVYISEHGAGEAYSYDAVEKIGKRPVIYSATGTHAVYATPGLHPYVLPLGLLHDQTDRGPLWDPNLNHHAFVYNHTSRILKSSAQTPRAPVSWFYFEGHWGDKSYPSSDRRQYKFLGQYHYVNGPSGPRYKNLGRKKVCQRRGHQCLIKHWLGDDNKGRKWPGKGPGDGAEDIKHGDDE